MKLSGERKFDVPRAIAWRALLDPEILSRTLPGCDALERVGEHEFRGGLNVRVGPVQGRFAGTVRLSELVPERGFRIRIDGNGPHGFTNAEGHVDLDGDAAATTIRYDLEAQVGGRLASVGQRLLDSSARVIAQQALDGLGRQLDALAQAERTGGPDVKIAPATQAEFAAGIAKGLAREHRGALLAAVAALAALALVLFWLLGRG